MGKAKKERGKANQLRKMNSGKVDSFLEKASKEISAKMITALLESSSSSNYFLYDYVLKNVNLKEMSEVEIDSITTSIINLVLIFSEIRCTFDIVNNQFVFPNEEMYNVVPTFLENIINTENFLPEDKKIYAIILEGFKQNKISKRFKNNAE